MQLVAFDAHPGSSAATLRAMHNTPAHPMTIDTAPPAAVPTRTRRLLDLTVVRIVLALLMTGLAGGLANSLVFRFSPERLHTGWPSLCGAIAALAGYALYVRWIERRDVSEFGRRGAPTELGAGIVGGAAMVAAVMGALALAGAYRFGGFDATHATLVSGAAKTAFVAVFEELLMRAILFRLVERSLGTWPALAISSLLFGFGHMPNSSADALSVVIAIVAGAFFALAFLATRRLWLCIGLHAGWNFTLGYVFSIAVSGHPRTPGILTGDLVGPYWLTGGAYGIEASVLTLATLLAVGAWLLQRAAARGHLVAWSARATRRRPAADNVLSAAA